MDEQVPVAFDVARVLAVEMDQVGIEGQSREAEEQRACRNK